MTEMYEAMSKVLINQYYSNLDKAVQFGKSMNETTIRSYFWMLFLKIKYIF